MARSLEHAPVTAVGVRSYSAGEAERVRQGIPGYRIVHGWEMDDERWFEAQLTANRIVARPSERPDE